MEHTGQVAGVFFRNGVLVPPARSSTTYSNVLLAFTMTSDNTAVSKPALWGGRTMSIVPALLLVFSAVMKFNPPPDAAEGFDHLGVSMDLSLPLGILELACVIIYLVPQTAVVGAILLTGYLGGAIMTHVRVADPFFMQPVLGTLFWAGLWLRDSRLRTLIPLRRRS